MKLFTVVLSSLLFIFQGNTLRSQAIGDFLVKKVDMKGVPPETDFSCLQQDDEGFLWMGGLNGVYRFDGLRATRFLRDPADSNSLTHNYASTLAKDSQGNIWIGTFGGFLNRYERHTGKIKRIESWISSPARQVVRKAKAAKDGNIIAATALGIFKVGAGGRVMDSLLIPSTIHLANTAITDFLEYESDKFILTATTGVLLVDWKKRVLKVAPFLPPGTVYRCIERDGAGNFWIGSDSSLTILDKDFSLLKVHYAGAQQLKHTAINCIKKDGAGRLWIGAGTGLFVAGFQEIQKIQPGKKEGPGKIKELFVDKNGIVWLYSEGSGVYQVYQPGIAFKTIPGLEAYSRNQMIQSLLEEEPGSWLIGTMFGLFRYNCATRGFNEIQLTGSKKKLWIGAQFIDRNKGYWVGTFGQGVFYRPAGEAQFRQFTYQPQDKHTIPFNTIVSIAEDRQGNIWMGSYNSGNQSGTSGLCYYDPVTRLIHRVETDRDTNSFKAVSVSQMEQDGQQRLWIGTWDRGLYKTSLSAAIPEQNTFINFNESSAGARRISHNVVSCIRPGRNSRVWFGTISGGLNVLDETTGRVSWFTVKEGLSSNLVYRIEEDDQGILWLSTDNGITRFDPASARCVNYNTDAGLPARNFAFLTSMKCADGTIAFGTGNGQVVYFDPGSHHHLQNAQPVVITDIRVFNRSLEPGKGAILEQAAYLADTLHLDYDHSVISFELANMDFLNPERFTYAYKLVGFDKDWTYVSDRSSITYTNLDPGTYTLLLLNADHLGIWNEKPTRLLLNISPPFWQTWWFISLVTLAIAGLGLFFFRFRLQQKLRVFELRNRLHRDLHDDIGGTLSSVKAYSEILKDSPGNPVIAELIRDNSSEMLERLEVISWATDPQHDHFKSLKSRMVKFAAPLCHSKQIAFDLGSEGIPEEMLMPGEVRQNIFLVFKEAVSNMIKYAGATQCTTKLFIRKHQFVLQVKDNGTGHDGVTKGTGNGWKNMRKRSADLNGELVIDSAPGIGTIITLRLPFPFKIPNSWDTKRDSK